MTGVSRLTQARKAVRPSLKGRLMLSGPSGAGKTRCGLIIATELAEGAPILGIDTEKESMLTYADDFEFVHLPWQPPYDATELADVLREAGGDYGVIVVDSSSHFWRKEGGVLDVAGGKFTGWKEARPIQENLVEAILACKAHVILCARAKVEHVQETENGRQVVRKLGMAVQQDDDLEYELNVAVDLSMEHTATVTKSRTTALPVGRAWKAHQVVDLAGVYRDWLKGGEPPAPTAAAEALQARINALPDGQRKACKQAFFAAFGRPEQLRESSLGEAEKLIASFEGHHPDDPGRQPVPEPVPEPVAEEEPAANTGGPDLGVPVGSKEGQKLHRQLGAMKITAKADQEDIIFCASTGRTTHAGELTAGEVTAAYLMGQDIAEGRTQMADLRAVCDEHRTAALDTQLERSLEVAS